MSLSSDEPEPGHSSHVGERMLLLELITETWFSWSTKRQIFSDSVWDRAESLFRAAVHQTSTRHTNPPHL
ncbi:hypothetical protein NHX12_005163 [Muraenolepis orangiensis]|uniref:Uncharacterized protein n=1 Tax=Muraenolepis orangiensis TaxID=630683 RepID=A0A9Q0IBT2_9TELE|nr:hypothetical protein NHX12_005163 [Muraenolepis orangiensis]